MNFRRLIKDKAREIKLWRAFVEGRHSFDMEMKRPILYYEQLDNRRDYDFLDNQKKKENLCIVLAGYKEKLWKDVFERLKAYMPDNTDVCICSSGKKVDKLESVCKREHWSYLATKRNQVCDIQNLAILLHQKAKFIYKIDEDIFLTRYFFTNLKKRLIINPPHRYEVGFVAPLIPINGYSYVRLLERLNLIDEWEKRFNKAIYSEGLHHHRDILENPKAAKFMWGEEFPILADIDALAEMLNLDKDAYSLCNIRFSIGAILFTRKSWQEMGYFPVDLGRGMGGDEQTICSWCMMTSKAIVVDENTIVGHLGYGPQTKEMMNFYEQHRENFQLKM